MFFLGNLTFFDALGNSGGHFPQLAIKRMTRKQKNLRSLYKSYLNAIATKHGITGSNKGVVWDESIVKTSMEKHEDLVYADGGTSAQREVRL